MSETKKFKLSKDNKMIAGVCGGIAEHINADVTIIRIATVLISIFSCVGIIAYFVIWIVGNNAKDDETTTTEVTKQNPQENE